MTIQNRPIIRLTGFLLGGLLAAGLILAGRLPATHAEVGARLTIDTAPTSALGFSPAGRELLTARDLRPGGKGVRGAVTLTAYAPGTLSVRLRVASGDRNLDDLVRLDVTAGDGRLFRGTLAQLRRWTARDLRLAMREKRTVELRAWIPASVHDGYQSRSAELTLAWRTRRARG
jgi:hypothetical protein